MSQEAAFKLCPECRGEYRLEALRCAECDVELVAPEALEAQEQEAEAFPAASELACVRVAPLAWVRALSEALQQQGVAHRVEPATEEDAPEGQRPEVFGNAALFALYVRDAQHAVAAEVDAGIAAQLLPDEAPVLGEGDQDACPACGTALSADAAECPECGLSFG